MTPILRAVAAVHQRAIELVEDGFPVSARVLLTNTARALAGMRWSKT